MRRIAVLVVVGLIGVGCGDVPASGPGSAAITSPTTVAVPSVPSSEEDRIEVMALALRAVAADFNTFGSGYRFAELLVQSRTNLNAGGGGTYTAEVGRLFTPAERQAIEDAISDLGSYRWIEDPSAYWTDDLQPVIPGSAIIGVGEVVFDERGALVPVSLWCGPVCAFGADLRLVFQNGSWSVVGPEGGMMIS